MEECGPKGESMRGGYAVPVTAREASERDDWMGARPEG